MRKVVIPGGKMHSADMLHAFLAEQLKFPEHYGQNLDALWDMLTGWVELPLEIVWEDFQESQIRLGKQADGFARLFQEAQEQLEGFQFRLR